MENTGLKRDQTLKASLVDEEQLVDNVVQSWDEITQQKDEFYARMREWEASWRDTVATDPKQGPYGGSANFRSRMVLSYGKAVHAKLWQLFSNPEGFFSVKSRTEAFKDKEVKIQQYMNWVLEKFANSKNGVRRELDRWLWDVVFKGNGYWKSFWKVEESEYRDIVTEMNVKEKIVFDEDTLTGRVDSQSYQVEKEVVKTDKTETPQLRRILPEDVVLPIGQSDPQESDFVLIKCHMGSEDLKSFAEKKLFFKDAVEAALAYQESKYEEPNGIRDIKDQREVIDGVSDSSSYLVDRHEIIEFYGWAYVGYSTVDFSEFEQDVNKRKKHIVAWIHKGTKRVLGWTYLHRISAGGIRPIFKADYVQFPDRTEGVGVPELIYDEVQHIEAIRNLRFDNGILASNPMGFYRASTSGLKPTVHEVRPGIMIPVDDPNDVRFASFPFLANFGYQEESLLQQDMERKIALSDLQMGITPNKVGALRNATGSNYLASESNIQLEIHYDRIASCMSKVLQFLFRLCRERMPEELYYRVEDDIGRPVFGMVNRDDLKGEYDFDIMLDILGQSQTERQQQSVLMMQTLMNGAFLQTGVVTPSNIYSMGKNFLRSHKVYRVDEYLTPPPDYQGEIISPSERIFRIVVGRIDSPKIEDTVRLGEDHQAAIKYYEDFKNTDNFGLLTQPAQLTALEALIAKHKQYLEAQNAGGMINSTGLQMPSDNALPAQLGGGGSPLQPEVVGQANGPVV